MPSKPGTSSPWPTPGQDGPLRNIWKPNATTITPDEHGDHGLELAEPAALQAEDHERGDADEEGGGEERQAGQQVDADRRADELGDVRRHRDQLGLDPEPERDPAREPLATDLGQVHPGRDPELRAHRLDQHRHQVGDEHDPEEQVAELGAAGHVGGEVARVDVGHRGDEGRSEEGRVPADAAPLTAERALRGPEHDRLAGERLLGADDERARLGGLDQAGATPAGRSGSGHRRILPTCLEVTKSGLAGERDHR